jgi:hypothetical protein
MLSSEQKGTIELYNEKASKLRELTFSRLLLSNGIHASFNFENYPDAVLDLGDLSREHIDAFVLTVRFFIQNKDPISFSKLAEIYSSLDQHDPLREKFEIIRKELNTSLDIYAVNIEGKSLSYRDILFTTIYGDLAHADREKRAEIEEWNTYRFRSGFIFLQFLRSLNILLKAINQTSEINCELLKR